MSRSNNGNEPKLWFNGTILTPILATAILIRDICVFVRDFGKIIANPWWMFFEILCLVLLIVIAFLYWRGYFRNRKKSAE